MPRFSEQPMAFNLAVDVMRYWLAAGKQRREIVLDQEVLHPPTAMTVDSDGRYDIGMLDGDVAEAALRGESQPLKETLQGASEAGAWLLVAVATTRDEIDSATLEATSSEVMLLFATDGTEERFATAMWHRHSDRPGDLELDGWEAVSEANVGGPGWLKAAREAYQPSA